MYLAEDRILCFEIVTKKREGWMCVFRAPGWILPYAKLPCRLKYVKSAKAATDVPTTVSLSHHRVTSLVTDRCLLGSWIHISTPSVAEWFSLCFDTRNCLLVPHLDIWARLFPQARPAGMVHVWNWSQACWALCYAFSFYSSTMPYNSSSHGHHSLISTWHSSLSVHTSRSRDRDVYEFL